MLLNSVAPDSPAERGGLLVGDILLNLDGEPIFSPDELAVVLRSDLTGKETTLQVIRGGALQEVTVEIEPKEEQKRQ